MMDAQSGVSKSSGGNFKRRTTATGIGAGSWTTGGGDTGTASRFFHCLDADPFVYQAKASRSDRGSGNDHPTVKSIALMRHLVRLITPPGGLVLDPFAGSGSTGVACLQEGLRFVGIEKEQAYADIAIRRIEAAQAPICKQVAVKHKGEL